MKLSTVQARGVIAMAVIVSVAAVALVARSWAFPSVPDPESASREAILRWLVQGNVADQPEETQLAFVDRLEREMSAGLDVSPASELLSENQREQLERNISTLKRVWFVSQVESYAQTDADERNAFMDQRIDTVVTWSAMEDSLQPTPGNNGGSAVAEFFEEIEDWIVAETNDTRQDQMWVAVYDGIFRWLSKYSLADQPFDLRADLALRIAKQVDAGMTVADLAIDDPEELKQLHTNAELLMEAWLREQSQVYAPLTGDQRKAFLSAQIDRVENSGVFELLSTGDSGQVSLLRVLALTQQWVQRAPVDERRALQQLLSDVQVEMFRRKLQSGL